MLSRWRSSYAQARDREDLHTLLYAPTLGATPPVLGRELVALIIRVAVALLLSRSQDDGPPTALYRLVPAPAR